jgi:phosphohistidine phosphatase
MKTLLVMRHAKSSWAEPTQADHDRPLNKRGKKAAPLMGRLLQERDAVPDLILSSTAMRAVSTARAVAESCGYAGVVEERRELYLAEPEGYLAVIRGVPSEVGRLLVVGHNPGAENLIEELTGELAEMPTAAIARIALAVDTWSALELDQSHELAAHFRPKELDD